MYIVCVFFAVCNVVANYITLVLLLFKHLRVKNWRDNPPTIQFGCDGHQCFTICVVSQNYLLVSVEGELASPCTISTLMASKFMSLYTTKIAKYICPSLPSGIEVWLSGLFTVLIYLNIPDMRVIYSATFLHQL